MPIVLITPRTMVNQPDRPYVKMLEEAGFEVRYPTNPEREVIVESVAPGWRAAPHRELKYTMAESDAYGGQYGLELVRQFIISAMRNDTPANGAENALRVMQIIEAAYHSNSSGRTVKVGEERR